MISSWIKFHMGKDSFNLKLFTFARKLVQVVTYCYFICALSCQHEKNRPVSVATEDIAFGAVGPTLVSLSGQIGHSVAHGSPAP